jgi:hypothetical protein
MSKSVAKALNSVPNMLIAVKFCQKTVQIEEKAKKYKK